MQNNAKTGGILTIISGAFSIFYLLWMVLYVVLFYFAFSMEGKHPSTQNSSDMPAEFLTVMIIFMALFGLFYAAMGALSITGGVMALKKKRWAFALAGAIIGSVIFFPTGIAATVFISLARAEFQNQPPPTILEAPTTGKQQNQNEPIAPQD